MLVLVTADAAGAVGAQVGGDERDAVEACIEEGLQDGQGPLAATQDCVDDPEALDECLQDLEEDDLSIQEAVDSCLDTLYEGAVTPEGGGDTTTTGGQTVTTRPTIGGETDDPASEDPDADDPDPAADGADGADRDGGSSSDSDSDTDRRTPLLVLVAIALGAFVGGAVVATVLARQRQAGPAGTAGPPTGAGPPFGPAPVPGAPVPGAHPHAPAPVTPAPAVDGSAQDRRDLIRALVELGDLVTSDALRTNVAERLAAVGVLPVLVAPGTPFDPARHRGVQAVDAPTPAQDGTVASCDRPGWSDRGTVLRPPEVVVYRRSGT